MAVEDDQLLGILHSFGRTELSSWPLTLSWFTTDGSQSVSLSLSISLSSFSCIAGEHVPDDSTGPQGQKASLPGPGMPVRPVTKAC